MCRSKKRTARPATTPARNLKTTTRTRSTILSLILPPTESSIPRGRGDAFCCEAESGTVKVATRADPAPAPPPPIRLRRFFVGELPSQHTVALDQDNRGFAWFELDANRRGLGGRCASTSRPRFRIARYDGIVDQLELLIDETLHYILNRKWLFVPARSPNAPGPRATITRRGTGLAISGGQPPCNLCSPVATSHGVVTLTLATVAHDRVHSPSSCNSDAQDIPMLRKPNRNSYYPQQASQSWRELNAETVTGSP